VTTEIEKGSGVGHLAVAIEAADEFHQFLPQFGIGKYLGGILGRIGSGTVIEIGQQHRITSSARRWPISHMTGRMPSPSMKKITPGRGPGSAADVKSEAGQVPSRVLMETSRRGMARFLHN
jgi:hypothetical protein